MKLTFLKITDLNEVSIQASKPLYKASQKVYCFICLNYSSVLLLRLRSWSLSRSTSLSAALKASTRAATTRDLKGTRSVWRCRWICTYIRTWAYENGAGWNRTLRSRNSSMFCKSYNLEGIRSPQTCYTLKGGLSRAVNLFRCIWGYAWKRNHVSGVNRGIVIIYYRRGSAWWEWSGRLWLIRSWIISI